MKSWTCNPKRGPMNYTADERDLARLGFDLSELLRLGRKLNTPLLAADFGVFVGQCLKILGRACVSHKILRTIASHLRLEYKGTELELEDNLMRHLEKLDKDFGSLGGFACLFATMLEDGEVLLDVRPLFARVPKPMHKVSQCMGDFIETIQSQLPIDLAAGEDSIPALMGLFVDFLHSMLLLVAPAAKASKNEVVMAWCCLSASEEYGGLVMFRYEG